MVDTMLKLKDFVPLFQDFLWIIFLGIILFVFRRMIKDLFLCFIDRIKKGSSVRIGNFELFELKENLKFIGCQGQKEIKLGFCGNEREKHRISIYEHNRGLFLTHVIIPSKRKEYKDIYIYLIRHKPIDNNKQNFLDIAYAEFFFGHMWGNEVFKVEAKKGIIGISTSAYAPFLCTCIIKMKDESEIELHRYIDFEAGNNL